MHFQHKLFFLLRAHPYSCPFDSFSTSYKSTVATSVHNVATQLSGQQPEQLYKYLFHQSRIFKNTFSNIESTTKSLKMLMNLKTMHANAPMKHKSNILSLLVDLFTCKELKQAGFIFSHSQYTTAKK